ncbi:hypothetical protein [Actinophytocola gossypii]|uniref:hypothetical protein n=1 Tax=Actinophytocola gossypii TaxID=2812003 RepID=UPI0021A8CC2C|nr:hypothetical protein [Actinophytocola gossypii]
MPFLWMVDQGRLGSTVSTHVLKGGRYVEDTTAGPGRAVTITAAPVPVSLDPASLRP